VTPASLFNENLSNGREREPNICSTGGEVLITESDIFKKDNKRQIIEDRGASEDDGSILVVNPEDEDHKNTE
jgi:hypothetical protein